MPPNQCRERAVFLPILYETFTGKRAFTATNIAELREQKERNSPAAPSETRASVDPAVDRLIMRCLERDPKLRPASVGQLAGALPGGDPLAAAIAAGETPSPEMLAAAGEKQGLRPAIAVVLLSWVIIGAFATVVMAKRVSVLERVGPGKPPEVLAERAKDVLAKAGYTNDSVDRAFGFTYDTRFLNYLRDTVKTSDSWDGLKAFNPVTFWYRESLQPLQHVSATGGVTAIDPPLRTGDVSVRLDSDGRLRRFEAIIEPSATGPRPASSPDWASFFSAAGFDPSHWSGTTPQSNVVPYADMRMAWQGSLPKATGIPVRIEAAAYAGKPVYFDIVGPWAPTATPAAVARTQTSWQTIVNFGLIYGIVAGGLLLARQNLRSGRGDRRGASRLALAFLLLHTVSWLLSEHHIWTGGGEWNLLYMFLGRALVMTGILWSLYLAMEPLVRRRWPHVLITWTRLLSGGFRDPLVGRDVLIGCGGVMVYECMRQLQNLAPAWFGSISTLSMPSLNSVLRTSNFLSDLFEDVALLMLLYVGGVLLFISLLRLVVRRDWLATAIAALLPTAISAAANPNPWIVLPTLAINAFIFFGLMRFGLVALLSGVVVYNIFQSAPMMMQSSAWYSGYTAANFLIVAALASCSFYTSLGGRRVFDGTTVSH